jgi:hypothetical protein
VHTRGELLGKKKKIILLNHKNTLPQQSSGRVHELGQQSFHNPINLSENPKIYICRSFLYKSDSTNLIK